MDHTSVLRIPVSAKFGRQRRGGTDIRHRGAWGCGCGGGGGPTLRSEGPEGGALAGALVTDDSSVDGPLLITTIQIIPSSHFVDV